ncbi:hypothetical protein JCM37172_09170 [Faecalimonas hominis]
MQEQSKKLVTGKLKEVACQKIDEQTEALVSMIGDNQVDYRFFLGFKLMVTEEQLNLKNIKKSAWLTFKEFLHEVNHTLMNDFVSMPNDEINRYMKMEKLLENKISRRFKVRRLEIHDFGYLMEHLYGRDGIAYEDYEYQLPKKKLQKETLIKYYDLIRPTRCVIEESQRYLRLEHEDRESYVSYFTVNAIVGELDFPSSEIFYFQQQQFTFPVDTSMNVEIVENRKALTTVRNKKKELKDLDNHAYQAGSETSSNVVDALDSVDELETDLDQTKESMYKLSYVVRVSADDLDELKRRCDEVKDFYDDLNVKLVRPAGDMLGLHSEFLPASKRYINDYVQYVKSDFLAGLGFGATQQLGETTGIYMGYSVDIIQVESGGTAEDVMQSSESLGLPPNSLDTESSIKQGCKYFASLLSSCKNQGIDDLNVAIQSYNYGGGYVGYVAGKGKKHTFNLAESFAREKSGGKKVTYTNPIAVAKNGGWRYQYGNQFYVELVNQYLTVPQVSGELAQKVMNEALKYQGWKYVYGGSNPNTSFDCSGLTQWCYGKAGISLPRTAQAQYDATQHLPLSQAKAGDLVFFHSTYNAGSYVTHVGILVSPTQMYHAGDPIGYADLSSSYWQQHLIGAGRVKQ